jgi:hypothetical protein
MNGEVNDDDRLKAGNPTWRCRLPISSIALARRHHDIYFIGWDES